MKRFVGSLARAGYLLGLFAAAVLICQAGAPVEAAPAPAAPETASASRTYVGMVKGGHASARLALVVKDGEFVAYVCSQDEDFNKANATWFRGKVSDGAIDATNDAKRTLKGKVADKTATLILGGGKGDLTVEAALVSADTVAGLYRQEAEVVDQSYVAGWIVDPEGAVAGAVKGKQIATPKPPAPVTGPKDVAKVATPVGTGPTAIALKPSKVVSPVFAAFQVTSVKNLGNTVGDDSTDRIEIKWDIKPDVAPQVKEYIVELTVTYGDGTTNANSKTVTGTARSAEVRVIFKSTTPTKSFNVRITAIPKDAEFGVVRTALKSGNF